MDVREYLEFLRTSSLHTHIYVNPELDVIIEVQVTTWENGVEQTISAPSQIRVTSEACEALGARLAYLFEIVRKYKFVWEPILNAFTRKR